MEEPRCFNCDHEQGVHIGGPCTWSYVGEESSAHCTCNEFLPRVPIRMNTGVVADHPTDNGNIYPLEVLQKAVEQAQARVEQRQMWGSLGFPEGGRTQIKDVSHIVTALKLHEDGRVTCDIEPTRTPHGRVLYELIRMGSIRIGMRGMGSVQDGMVGPDFSITSFDVVPDEDMEP